MIRFDSVTKLYRGGARLALDKISLEIGSGEFVFLVGASGSGKSSLLRLMLREERPTSGEIHVLGQRLTTISTRKVPYFRRSLGVVFQDFRLLPNKTVHDNVAFALQVLGKSRGFIQEAVPDVLGLVGLAGKAANFPNELSGGEQQRVAIARAVVNKPKILLADEPTGNLDPTTSDGIMQVLEHINVSGTTVVMATHDVTIVDRLQKRVVELVDGTIVRDELDAKYVTTAIPVQEMGEDRAEEQPAFVPVWARSATGPVIVPGMQSSRGSVGPKDAPVDAPAVTGPLRLGTGPLPVVGRQAERTAPPSSELPQTPPRWAPPVEGGDRLVRPAPAAPAERPESVEPARFLPARPAPRASAVPTSGGAPATGALPLVHSASARGGTGASAAPRADPAQPASRPAARPDPGLGGDDARSLFFAAPIRPAPEERTSGGPPRWSETEQGAAPIPAFPRGVATPVSVPDGLGDDDQDDGLTRTGRHRIVLPEHLDFVGNLGLRGGGRDENGEVGPSS